MGVEAKALKVELGCVKAQEGYDNRYGNAAYGGGRVGVVSSDWGVGVGTNVSEVEETVGSGGDGVSMIQVGGLHGGGLYPDTVLQSVKE